MKKLIIILFATLVLSSCARKSWYTVTFEEHLPTRIDTVTLAYKFSCEPRVQSYQGTNYIGLAYESTAPLIILKSKKSN